MVDALQARASVPAGKLDRLLTVLGWKNLNRLGDAFQSDRLALWVWILDAMHWDSDFEESLVDLAMSFPMSLPAPYASVAG